MRYEPGLTVVLRQDAYSTTSATMQLNQKWLLMRTIVPHDDREHGYQPAAILFSAILYDSFLEAKWANQFGNVRWII